MKHISDNEYIEGLIANRGLNGVVELGKRVGKTVRDIRYNNVINYLGV